MTAKNKDLIKIGGFANLHGYTDVQPYEIIGMTKTTLKLREMKAELAEGQKPEFMIGGFSGHCTNQHQLEYTIQADPEGSVVTAHLRKDGCYHSVYGRHILSAEPRRFYDYSF